MKSQVVAFLPFGLVVCLAAAAFAVKQQDAAGHDHASRTAPAVVKGVAVLRPTAGNQVAGTVAFAQEGDAVRVVADVTGLKPNAKHGFHIHEFGDCSAMDGTSAGGHFNPMGMPHGAPTDSKHHGGDFGNLEANADGKAHLELVMQGISLGGGPTSILGRGVIVHLLEDDLKSQPTGNAGARSACGTIGIAKDGIAKY